MSALQGFLARHNAPFSLTLEHDNTRDTASIAPALLHGDAAFRAGAFDPRADLPPDHELGSWSSAGAAAAAAGPALAAEDGKQQQQLAAAYSPMDIRDTAAGPLGGEANSPETAVSPSFNAHHHYHACQHPDAMDVDSGAVPAAATACCPAEPLALPPPSAPHAAALPPSPYGHAPAACGGRPKIIKRYTNPTPSNYCHICCRARKRGAHMICSNVRSGICRKVICDKCFSIYGWDWESASAPGSRWVCPHCSDTCPPRAQCNVYMKGTERKAAEGGGRGERDDV